MIGEEHMNKNFQLSKILNEWKWTILAGLGIVVLFFLLRLINLTILPIFCDEAIYIRWAQVMRAEPTLRFLPLSDGKQPLFMWLVIPFLKFFADPLVAGRMVSILAGLASLVGLFLTTYYLLKSKKAALFSMLIYSFLPFSLFMDRLALVDSLLLTFGIWVFFLASLLVENQRIDLAILTGIVLGGALITKSPAVFFAGMIPSTILLLKVKRRKGMVSARGGLAFGSQLIKLAGLWMILSLFAFTIYNLLRLGPNFQMIAIRNKDYVFTLKEILSHPHNPFLIHLKDLAGWFPNLFTWPIFILSLLGMIIGLIKKRRIFLVLLVWFALPILFQSLFAKVFTPRYVLFAIFPLIIFASFAADWFLNKLKKKIYLWPILLILIFSLAIRYDYLLISAPEKAPLPEGKRRGYLVEWTSGYGIKEVRDYLKEVSKNQRIVVGTEGHFGTLPDGLMIYFDKDSQVTILGVGINLEEIPKELREAAQTTPTYLVINQSRIKIKDETGLKLILKIPKQPGPKGQDFLLLYQLE